MNTAPRSGEPTRPATVEPLPRLSGNPDFGGGQANLWRHPADGNRLVKVFNEPRMGADADHLMRLVEVPSQRSLSEQWELRQLFAWPTKVFGGGPDQIAGIEIPLAPAPFWFEERMHDQRTMDRKPLELSRLLSNPDRPAFAEHTIPAGSIAERAEILLRCGRALEMLWGLGLIFGDISAKNILWTTEGSARAMFIDVEACRPVGSIGVYSPDWAPPHEHKSSTEGERIVFARLVWRTFAVALSAEPAAGWQLSELPGLLPSVHPALVDAILECHASGTTEQFERLIDELRSLRTPDIERATFEHARTSRFARLILEHAPSLPDRDQADHIRSAARQRDREGVLRFRPAATIEAEPGFDIDHEPHSVPLDRISTATELRFLFEAAQFTRVADLYARGLVLVGANRSLTRAIEHALVEVGIPDVTLHRAGAAVASLEINWPTAVWANRIILRECGADRTIRELAIVRRAQSPVRVDRWHPLGAVLEVSFAVADPTGTVVQLDRRYAPTMKFELPRYDDVSAGLPETQR